MQRLSLDVLVSLPDIDHSVLLFYLLLTGAGGRVGHYQEKYAVFCVYFEYILSVVILGNLFAEYGGIIILQFLRTYMNGLPVDLEGNVASQLGKVITSGEEVRLLSPIEPIRRV